MAKHAYLIIAHKNVEQLNYLISLLDDERNDIYIHLDKKSSIQESEVTTVLKGNVYFIPRKSAHWGSLSEK